MGGFGGSIPGGPIGVWDFDDCNSLRTNLSDRSGSGNTAFRSVSVQCAEGISRLGLALADKEEDLVYVPDQPTFDFGGGVTVAGWVNASSIGQVRTLFRKREEGNSSSFALVMNNNGKYQFVIKLADGTAASVTAPPKAVVGKWTHVAATYDGTTLRIFVDGAELAIRHAPGVIAPGAGPLLMGNDGSKRLFAGRIDQALVDRRALAPAEIAGLTCVRRDPTVVATPTSSPPTPANTPFPYDIAITNNDSPSCPATGYQFSVNSFFPGINVEPTFTFVTVPAGQTGHVTMNVTGTDFAEEAGAFQIFFNVFAFTDRFISIPGSVEFNLTLTGCRVSRGRELMITSTSVVEDPVRTAFDEGSTDPRNGAWTFKRLFEAMAPTPADAPAMVEDMLGTFTVPQTINGFTVEPRPGLPPLVLDNWPRTPEGALDLARAPMRLLAIVNRFDLRNLDAGHAGEGRFVFGFVSTFPGFDFPLQATMILEYLLPASTEEEALDWANDWHALGSLDLGTEAYNAALQALTDRFAARGVFVGRPNGSAIAQVRTNEIDFGANGIWELREFMLAPDTGLLVPTTVKLTPDGRFNFTETLGSFVNAHEPSILLEKHNVPELLDEQPFLAGAIFNNLGTWFAPNITNPEARHKFALNTCNGCHSVAETNTVFLMVNPRFPGQEATLSSFLTGTTVIDPSTSQPRTLNDLGRRSADLRAIVCPNDPPPPMGGGSGGSSGGAGTGGTTGGTGVGGGGGSATGAGGFGGRGTVPVPPSRPAATSLRHGINRVH